MIKAGARLQSQVCQTQVIIVKSDEGLDDLRCGGAPMIPIDSSPSSEESLCPSFSDGTVMGKRYTDGAGAAELLVTRSGQGTLSIGDTRLELKATKPLPASD